jgi:hypothetical protein
MINENTKLSKNEKLVIAYCRHIENGYSENSFPQAASSDVEKIAAELDLSGDRKTNYKEMLETAKRKGQLFWERIGLQGILEKEKKFNGSVWMFTMKNRFGWKDKQPEEAREENKIVRVKLGFEECNVQGEK